MMDVQNIELPPVEFTVVLPTMLTIIEPELVIKINKQLRDVIVVMTKFDNKNWTKRMNLFQTLFFCKDCLGIFKNFGSHQEKCRSDISKQFVCDYCGKLDKIKKYFISHLTTHLAIRKRKFQCKKCNRKFLKSSHLKTHLGNLKKHICKTSLIKMLSRDLYRVSRRTCSNIELRPISRKLLFACKRLYAEVSLDQE